jgi:hypothetical protein
VEVFRAFGVSPRRSRVPIEKSSVEKQRHARASKQALRHGERGEVTRAARAWRILSTVMPRLQ